MNNPWLGLVQFFAFMIFCALVAWNVYLWHVDITTRARRKRQRLLRKIDAAMRTNRK